MKIAITADGNNPGSSISKKFARCLFFAIFDTETLHIRFVENRFKTLEEHAGEEAVNFLVSEGVKRIISCEFGSKARKLTNEHKIQLVVYPDDNKTIEEIMEMLKSIHH
jgi:predicted Fe-Mo cluster-binding NifX family protein